MFYWRNDLRIQTLNALNNCVFINYSEIISLISKYSQKNTFLEIKERLTLRYINKTFKKLKRTLPNIVENLNKLNLFDKNECLKQQLNEKLKYQKKLELEIERLKNLKNNSFGDDKNNLEKNLNNINEEYKNISATIEELNLSLNNTQ
ncbi:Hypothetical protein SRAE_X000233300 [Strongyloides ratti]|uniref:Uncharacterized protein n=1 Tax=Strongyloides ratti TaxID=34506 RepID=A0A090MQZ8_STRRB|nr:Hypothetical protein SRAE_X000233300 [Strongyloides ratti]CEF60598.1 Hypothetical protein SRAE_X000233300 [Strongyloides ratti]